MQDFDELYRQYFMHVYKFSMGLCRDPVLAEEITQETFFKALQKIDGFKGGCSLTTWLCRIARNLYIDHTRKKEQANDPMLEQTPDGSDLEERLADREMAYAIHRALHTLKEPYKEIFWLRTFGELPFAKIGELFGKSESWARVIYYRAKIQIKEEIK